MICQPVVSSAELGQPMKLDGAIQAAQEVLAEVQRLHNSTIEVSVQEKKTQKKIALTASAAENNIVIFVIWSSCS